MARAEEACSPSGPGGWCDVFAVDLGWVLRNASCDGWRRSALCWMSGGVWWRYLDVGRTGRAQAWGWTPLCARVRGAAIGACEACAAWLCPGPRPCRMSPLIEDAY